MRNQVSELRCVSVHIESLVFLNLDLHLLPKCHLVECLLANVHHFIRLVLDTILNKLLEQNLVTEILNVQKAEDGLKVLFAHLHFTDLF